MSKLLIDEYPLVVLPQLAKAIGLNEAIILQQVHYWVNLYRQAGEQHHFQQGEWWVWNTGSEWATNFPFWSECTVRRILDSLRKPYTPKDDKDNRLERKPLIIVGRFNKKGYDQTLWYRIDYEEVARLEAILAECVNGDAQNDKLDVSRMSKPIPETTTETTTNTLAKKRKRVSVPEIVEYKQESGDIQFRCSNPECDDIIIIQQLPKTGAECPHCHVPVRVRDEHGKVIRKPSQKARRQESGFDGQLERFDDKPLRAFCALYNIPYDGMKPVQKKKWGYEIKKTADENDASANLTYEAIRAIKDSEHSWQTFKNPYQNGFRDLLVVMILRQKETQNHPIKKPTRKALEEKGYSDEYIKLLEQEGKVS